MEHLSIEDLVDLVTELRAAGYQAGTEQCVAAQSLLLGLAMHQYLPRQPEELCRWLGPVLCTTPSEQRDFLEHLRIWLERRRRVRISIATPSFGDDDYYREKLKRERYNKIKYILAKAVESVKVLIWNNFYVLLKSTALIVLGVLVVYLFWYSPITPPITVPPPPIPPDSYILTDSSPSWKITIVSALLLAFLARWLWQNRKAPSTQSVKGPEGKLFRDPRSHRFIQLFRHRCSTQTNNLDISATVDASSSKAGLFTPVYHIRWTTPDYLVLIDRLSFSDQQAFLAEEVIDRMREAGIYVECLYFQKDPRLFHYEKASRRSISLSELATAYRDSYLLIFSDGSGLMNPLTSYPQRWVKLFDGWSQRAIFTPLPRRRWGFREWSLILCGFKVLPATRSGIGAASEMFSGKLSKKVSGGWPFPDPELLQTWPTLVLMPTAPSKKVVYKLREELLRYLGDEDFLWLCACAAYPELDWGLTQYFVKYNTGNADFEERLLAFVCLPWFRYGSMPEWLRKELVSHLEKYDYEAEKIREAYNSLLTIARNGAQENIESLPEFVIDQFYHSKAQSRTRARRSSRENNNSVSQVRDDVFYRFMLADKPILPTLIRETKRRFLSWDWKLKGEVQLIYVLLFIITVTAILINYMPVIGQGRKHDPSLSEQTLKPTPLPLPIVSPTLGFLQPSPLTTNSTNQAFPSPSVETSPSPSPTTLPSVGNTPVGIVSPPALGPTGLDTGGAAGRLQNDTDPPPPPPAAGPAVTTATTPSTPSSKICMPSEFKPFVRTYINIVSEGKYRVDSTTSTKCVQVVKGAAYILVHRIDVVCYKNPNTSGRYILAQFYHETDQPLTNKVFDRNGFTNSEISGIFEPVFREDQATENIPRSSNLDKESIRGRLTVAARTSRMATLRLLEISVQ